MTSVLGLYSSGIPLPPPSSFGGGSCQSELLAGPHISAMSSCTKAAHAQPAACSPPPQSATALTSLQRPRLQKRSVSDYVGSSDATVNRRRRSTLANAHSPRRRSIVRRPSISMEVVPEPDELAYSPPTPMIRSVSLPVATRTEYEQQRRSRSDLAATRLSRSSFAELPAPVSWTFSWPSQASSGSLPKPSSSVRRLSSCSPLELNPEAAEPQEFPWTMTASHHDGTSELSPSSSSSSSIAASSGPPSPLDSRSPLPSSNLAVSAAAAAAAAVAAATSSPLAVSKLSYAPTTTATFVSPQSQASVSASSSSSTSTSKSFSFASPASAFYPPPRKSFSPLSNQTNLPFRNEPHTPSYSPRSPPHFSFSSIASSSSLLTPPSSVSPARRSSSTGIDGKLSPYPSPQRRRSLQGRSPSLMSSSGNGVGDGSPQVQRRPTYRLARRASSSALSELSPHLEDESENHAPCWPALPTQTLFTSVPFSMAVDAPSPPPPATTTTCKAGDDLDAAATATGDSSASDFYLLASLEAIAAAHRPPALGLHLDPLALSSSSTTTASEPSPSLSLISGMAFSELELDDDDEDEINDDGMETPRARSPFRT
ncbi:hypothetical protein V8E36_003422 [Tilletia maclaganii]